ncbi:unnamed protein product [Pleuronectes platessa]|uniref:Uncharacterized protein n=1 Tax=Pleuronectes platessa TaxID=8262 RepID=A0A9N7W2B0_PLEPL|nr:unnamed protein product [Pleuronectes platessa]
MRVNIRKDNPNMTCQAVPLQSHSMVSNQQDHDPPSRPERHSSPQSPSTVHRQRTRHRVRHHQHDQPTRHRIRHTGSTTTTPGARSTNRNPWCGHRGPGSAGDKAKGFRGRGIGMEKRKEKLEREAPCVMCHKFPLRLSFINGFCPVINVTMIQAELEATLRLNVNLTGNWFV